jgi:hypothetical protein
METMKKYLIINVLIIAFNINLFAQSEEQLDQNNYQYQNTLTNKKQSSFELNGFEGRAKQKLQELAGYIEIISNKEYDLAFREHALSMAKKVFCNEDVKISNSDINLSTTSLMTLTEYLNSFLGTGFTKILLEITNQQYVENLSKNKSDAYSGRLLFDQTNSYYKNNEIQKKNIEKKEVEIVLVKTDKSFGKKTKNVWNVYLGNIRVIENSVDCLKYGIHEKSVKMNTKIK